MILYNHLLQRRACASERQGATRLGFPPRTPQFQTPKTIRMSEGSAPLRFSSMDSAPAAVPDPPIVAAGVKCVLVSIPPCFSTPACVDQSAVDVNSLPGRLYTEYRNCGTGFTTERARWYRLRVHSTSSSSRLPGWSCWARPPAAAKLSDGGPSCGMAHARPNREKESASAPRVDTEPAPAAHGQFSASCDMGRRVKREPCVQVAETCAQDHVLERAGNIPHACAFGHGGELRRR